MQECQLESIVSYWYVQISSDFTSAQVTIIIILVGKGVMALARCMRDCLLFV